MRDDDIAFGDDVHPDDCPHPTATTTSGRGGVRFCDLCGVRLTVEQLGQIAAASARRYRATKAARKARRARR